jgi:hypothetical protein
MSGNATAFFITQREGFAGGFPADEDEVRC